MSGSALAPVRRFYKIVSAGPVDGGGFSVFLDGRTLRTPAKAVLRVPTHALAEATASEWQAQEEHIQPALMPITRLANVAIDRMPLTRNETIAEVLKYVGTDLLLVRAEEPEALVKAEADAWDPIVDWAMTHFSASFETRSGIMVLGQSPSALDAVRTHAEKLDDFRLTALAHLGALFGSSLLAFAVLKGRIDAAAGHDLSRTDESFQESRWGIDEEAAIRVANQRLEVLAVARFLQSLDG